jgi:crossover junction endodeoxyribonuclease RuvC
VGDGASICYIEKVSAMPKQGVTSMFNFGFSTGAIHGIVATLGIPRYLVTPQRWKNNILVGTKKDKEAAIDYCRRAFPSVTLLATEKSRKPHSGMADAICIALYAYHFHDES